MCSIKGKNYSREAKYTKKKSSIKNLGESFFPSFYVDSTS